MNVIDLFAGAGGATTGATVKYPITVESDAVTRHEQQRQADRAHHEGRIAWLTANAPCYADGERVPKHFAAEMLIKSREALCYIVDHGMSTNHAQLRCERA